MANGRGPNFQRLPAPAGSKYPFVGPRYGQYGEMPGYLYHPWTDLYYPDPKAVAQYNEDTGVTQKEEKPGILEQAAPVLIAGGALSAGTALGKDPAGFLGGIAKPIAGIFDSSVTTAPAVAAQPVTVAAPAVTPGIQATGLTGEGAGLFGSSWGAEAAPSALDFSSASAEAIPGISDVAPSALDLSGAAGEFATQTAAANAAPWWQAAEGSNAAALGSSIGAGLEGIGVGAQTAAGIGSVAGTAIPVIGAGLGGYQLYNNVMDGRKDPVGGALSGAATGAAIGSLIPGVGTLIGGGVGLLAGTALGSLGTGKDQDQINRDYARDVMRQVGFLSQDDEEDYVLRTRSGEELDIGIDGNGFMPGTQQAVYNIDPGSFTNPDDSQLIGALDPLGFILGGGDRKIGSDTTGMLFNTVKGSSDRAGDVKDLLDRAGGRDQLYNKIRGYDSEDLDPAVRDAFLASLDRVYGVKNPGA